MKLDNLSPSTTYKLSLMAKSTTGLISQANYYLVSTAPDPPIEFKASKVSSVEATMTWIKPVAKISMYILQLSHDGVSEERTLNSSKSTEVISELKPATRYWAQLRSIPVYKPVHSPPSIVSTSFVTHLPGPNITTTVGNEESVFFSWVHSYSNQISFQYMLQGGQFTEWMFANVTEKSYEIKNLKSNSLYFIQVKFVFSGIESESAFFDVRTKLSKNTISISNPSLSAITFNSATIIWENDGHRVDGYVIQYGPVDVEPNDLKQLQLSYSDDTIVDLNDLDEDTTYIVLIAAVVGDNSFPPSITKFHTGLGPPRNITVQYVTNDETLISWEEASASVQDYRIKYCKKIVDFLSPNFDRQGVSELFVTGLSATVSGLEADSSYEFEISAKQNFDKSFTEAIATLIHTLPDPVTGLHLQKSNFHWIKVAWNKPKTSVDKFELLIFDDTGAQIKELMVSSVKSVVKIDNLLAAKWYRVQLRSISDSLKSPKRSVMVHTELDTPSGVTVGNITENTAVVQWNIPRENCKTIVTLLNMHNTKRKVHLLEPGKTMFQIQDLNAGTQYIVRVQHESNSTWTETGRNNLPLRKNRIVSEFFDRKFRTMISYSTPEINMAYVTDYNALFNWDHTNYPDHTSNQHYIFQWRRADQA